MRARIRRLLPQGRFARRLAMLSGGTFIGQAVLLLSSPLLTRLYDPAAFGTLAVFTALSSILLGVSNLRYELAIPVCRDDEEAAAMVAVGTLTALVLSLLAAPVIAAGGQPLAAVLGMGGHAGLLWLLPPLMLAWGLTLSLGSWSIRRGTFRQNAVGNLVQLAGQAVAQLAFGLLGGGGGALVAGYALGLLGRLAVLLHALTPVDRRRLRRVSADRMRDLARAHWRYPVFSSASNLLQTASQMLPALFVAILYGPVAAGWFGLGQRIMTAPVRMLGEAASQVFLGEIAHVRGPALYRLFRRTAVRFFALGLVGMLPLLVAGPALFAFVFGEPWREAGAIVQLLVPVFLARFVVVPVSQTLNVLGRQHLHLTASVLNCAALGASFALSAWLDLPLLTTTLLYSMGSTAAFLFYFAAAWHTARHAALRPLAVAEPPAG